MNKFPVKQGLYDPSNEKDSCGIGVIAHLHGKRSHYIVQNALKILENLDHRGARGSDPDTGDGAGILTQVPHVMFESHLRLAGIELPEAGRYGVGMFFFPSEAKLQSHIEGVIAKLIEEEGLSLLGWRDVPISGDVLSVRLRQTQPVIRQCFISSETAEKLEQRLYCLRKRIENEVKESFYACSLSSQTIVYKGLLTPGQLGRFYLDLSHPDFVSAIAMVHSRFSTNTFPSWSLAHPFRYISHNGEINTIQGNLNWMKARQDFFYSQTLGRELGQIYPIVQRNQSDSASLDNALEFLLMGGYSLPHALLRLMPEPWVHDPRMSDELRGFYEYQSIVMEPWDGPALVTVTDGRYVAAHLDRNGLRPCRYQITHDDILVLSSEAGVLPSCSKGVRRKGCLRAGEILLADTLEGKLLSDDEVKQELSAQKPYKKWVAHGCISLDQLPATALELDPCSKSLIQTQKSFGFTLEEINSIIIPMALTGSEPTSSMGNDTPLAVLSKRPQLLFKYFKQHFAQVTNPPIDSIRESLVMSLVTHIGSKPGLFEEGPLKQFQLKVQEPLLRNSDLLKLREMNYLSFKAKTVSTLFQVEKGAKGLRERLASICKEAELAILEGYSLVILSDRGHDRLHTAIPSLLSVSAVHHYLIVKSLRTQVGIIVESGEPREVHHFACLVGYGANLINPYLAFETIRSLESEQLLPRGIQVDHALSQYILAVNKGLLKILSKMGISTIQSYCGAQLFEAVGLRSEIIDEYFTGTASRIEGIGLEEIAQATLQRHSQAFSESSNPILENEGEIHYRVQGEHHNWNPETIVSLQRATRENNSKTFKEFSTAVNSETETPSTLRGLLELVVLSEPLPLEEVEPAEAIVRRFTTGAMSFGALGKEAHETLAVAMNRIGAKSNSGEGGEDPVRFNPLPNGDSKNSMIKQIASARFGVTAHYLVNAQELQIKMSQGAKPGEGGQLPGHKVDKTIAKLRYATAGTELISPPPHHDIYSIEDLAQLIFDLKNVNSAAKVSVKLVAKAGVGTIAVGVVKAGADKVLISGDSGGTGASPLSSIKNAGVPWELGLSETHQTLVLNGLRERVRLETDGQLKTGRDVVIAALLGADEFGFSTAPLIVEGCIMMRKCHLNTCPVGIATQDPILRKKFSGEPEHLINYFFLVAEEVREWMSKLGFRTFFEMVGHTEKLRTKSISSGQKAHGLNLSSLLFKPEVYEPTPSPKAGVRDCFLNHVLDRKLIDLSQAALERQERVTLDLPIRNTNRSVGAMLSGEIAKRYGAEGLPADTLTVKFTGSAGQSFGAFQASGLTLILEGESNDYTGKGLSGGKIIIFPPRESIFKPDDSILVGNTTLYGATQGEIYLNGLAGERFAVRNSGATAVVEGVGDHACEYMTGGVVVVLGRTGRNFAAGMSGGLAYVLDEGQDFRDSVNFSMVNIEKICREEDQRLLHLMIKMHLSYTCSPKAERVLENWKKYLPLFKAVIPKGFKYVPTKTHGVFYGRA